MSDLVALDLFAGTGWGVACAILGIEEHGVELMPEAVETRKANGMTTLYNDVWHGLEHALAVPAYDILIASPPCQTFSMAGNGKGRKALDEVLGLIDSKAYLNVANLRAFGEAHDMRTALVLTPLAHVARDAPLYVVLEQVPQVLPVWERMAEELRRWGYSVVTGVLNAEQYGVPQTRKRAILIARADGIEARMPTPTHSRYYPNDKTRLDPDVEPWVSMATALGWGDSYLVNGTGTNAAVRNDEDPAPTMHFGQRLNSVTRVMRSQYTTGHGENAGELGEREENEPAATVTSKAYSNTVMVSNDKLEHSARRSADEPAPTITAGHDSGNRKWMPEDGAKYFHPMTYGRRGIHPGDEPAPTIRGVQRDMPEGYVPHPNDAIVFQGHQRPDSKRTGGEPDAYQTRDAELPAPSITSGSRSAQWLGRFNDQSGTDFDPEWPDKRPALTVATRDIVPNPGHNKSRHDESTKSRNDGVRVTVAEAAALQTYPATFEWAPVIPVLRLGKDTGRVAPMSKTKAFLQIGNAVPPLLARHVLSTIIDDMEG